jgi:2-keto-4-pentenoate hydratase/2-oxohepta-3-ene-1,7-dioic acid hydratase in catechol pathway
MIYPLPGDIFAELHILPGTAGTLLANVELLPPVQPSKIVCVGRNYAAHAAEHNAEVPSEPMTFLKPPSALIGPGVAIELPANAGRIDHEAELVIVIGRRIRHATRENALDAVLGYTCANDVSARDYQKKDGQWGRAKGFDTFCPLGPWIVTDLDPSDLAIRCTVNDAVQQDSRTSNMVFDVPALITFISSVMTLEPGDIILTGTPAGVSPLSSGDVVRVEIEGIGTLENPIRAASA